jgi:sugar lactone lactonase YvrE
MSRAEVVAKGLYFGEGPRWHDGRLWFSDFYDRAVKSMDAAGRVSVELQIDDQPSGLGWLPDGRMLVVAMSGLRVLRVDVDAVRVHAELGSVAKHLCNDMVVGPDGAAYVGNFGFDLDAAIARLGVEGLLRDHPTTTLVRISPDGDVRVAADEMHFPNGSVITPDGSTLIVAETLSMCLTAFDIEADGALSNRRVWAPVGMRAPDGICLDAGGNVWVANALAPECVLVAPGGEILEVVETSQPCFACMLGGEDGRRLHLLTAPTSDHSVAGAARHGSVETAVVGVPHAGWP